MTNKFPGTCSSCRSRVAAGRGSAYRGPSGWAVVCPSEACHRRAGLLQAPSQGAPASSAPPARRLTEDGLVYTPYEPDSLPLLRALPGARWDAASKAWRCSLLPQDRPRLLEILDRLRVEVPSSLREIPEDPATQVAVARARDAGGYPYQIDGVRWLSLRDRALLADDMGLGKTFQVLNSLDVNDRTLVVCPASLKYVWRDEAARWRSDFRVTILAGRDAWQTPQPGEIVVTNFDILPSFLAPVPTGEKDARGKDVLIAPVPEDVRAILPDMRLIVDEAHKVKSHKAARTAKIKTLTRSCKRVTFLTGTPLLGRPFDLWGVLDAGNMAGEALGGWNGFMRLFQGEKGRWGGYEFGGPLPETAEKVRRVMLRRIRTEVLPDLPRKRYQTITTNEMDARLRRDLDQAWEAWSSDDDPTRSELPDFREFSALRARLAASRIPALLEMIEDYEESEVPLVVMSAHRAPIDELGKREGWVVITGDTSAEARSEAVRKFQAGECKGIACTIQAGGVGLTLTRASTVIFVDLDWTPGNNAQAEDRVCRIGQRADSVLVIRMVSDHPLDQHVQMLLDEKQHLIEAAVERVLTPTITIPTALRPETDEELEARLAAIRTEIERVEREEALRIARGKIAGWRAEEEVPEVPYPADLRDLLRSAHTALSESCDGARERDGMGFNKCDTGRMRWMAMTGYESDADYWLVHLTIRKYQKQLGKEFAGLWKVRVTRKGAVS